MVNERLTEVFFKYRQDDSSEEEEKAADSSVSGSVGMFEDEDQKIKLKDVEAVVKEVGIVEWDPAVSVLIDEAERASGRLNMEKMKILIMTLLVRNKFVYVLCAKIPRRSRGRWMTLSTCSRPSPIPKPSK